MEMYFNRLIKIHFDCDQRNIIDDMQEEKRLTEVNFYKSLIT